MTNSVIESATAVMDRGTLSSIYKIEAELKTVGGKISAGVFEDREFHGSFSSSVSAETVASLKNRVRELGMTQAWIGELNVGDGLTFTLKFRTNDAYSSFLNQGLVIPIQRASDALVNHALLGHQLAEMQVRSQLPSTKGYTPEQEKMCEEIGRAMTSTATRLWDVRYNVRYPFEVLQEKMPEGGETGYVDPQFFEKTDRLSFTCREGRRASEAMSVLWEGPSLIDCGCAVNMCYLQVLLDILGSDCFDGIFAISPLVLEQRVGQGNNVGALLFQPVLFEEMKTGDSVHFRGIPWYSNKHPVGYGGGLNAIYVGKNSEGERLFAGLAEAPKTESEIYMTLIESYNRERTKEDEEYIRQSPEPGQYDRYQNEYLRMHYTVLDSVEQLKRSNMVGIETIVTRLDPVAILQIKERGVLALADIVISKLEAWPV